MRNLLIMSSVSVSDFSALSSPSLNARLLGGDVRLHHLIKTKVVTLSGYLDEPFRTFSREAFDDDSSLMFTFRSRVRSLLFRAEVLLSRLDINNTLQPDFFLSSLPKDDLDFIRSSAVSHFSDFPRRPASESRFSTSMRIASSGVRRRLVLDRLTIELTLAYKQRQFIVFDTWTVDPARWSSNIFISKTADGNRCSKMQVYLRSIHDAVLARVYPDLTVAQRRSHPDKDQHFRRFSVVERHKSGAYHCHVILILSCLPTVKCETDPNYLRCVPSRRQLDHFPVWPYGFSTPIAVRLSANDAYGSLGWKWPSKDGQPISPCPPLQLARYLSKYLTKGACVGQSLYRPRFTRNFGLSFLVDMYSSLSLDALFLIFLFPSDYRFSFHGCCLSSDLIKEAVFRVLRGKLRVLAESDFQALVVRLSSAHYPMSMFKSLLPDAMFDTAVSHLSFVDDALVSFDIPVLNSEILKLYDQFSSRLFCGTGSMA